MDFDQEYELELSQIAPSERDRKIFIGGLSWMTSEESVFAYFKSLGEELDRVVIMREKMTGRSRGFGFIVTTKAESIDRIVGVTHVIDSKKIEAKKAIPKSEMNNPAKKIFVGGVPLTVDDSQFRAYFDTFGSIVESQIIRDRLTGRSRGFGFVTFTDEKTAEAVLLQSHHIAGKEVEVKMAEPRKQQNGPVVHHVIQPLIVSSSPWRDGYVVNQSHPFVGEHSFSTEPTWDASASSPPFPRHSASPPPYYHQSSPSKSSYLPSYHIHSRQSSPAKSSPAITPALDPTPLSYHYQRDHTLPSHDDPEGHSSLHAPMGYPSPNRKKGKSLSQDSRTKNLATPAAILPRSKSALDHLDSSITALTLNHDEDEEESSTSAHLPRDVLDDIYPKMMPPPRLVAPRPLYSSPHIPPSTVSENDWDAFQALFPPVSPSPTSPVYGLLQQQPPSSRGATPSPSPRIPSPIAGTTYSLHHSSRSSPCLPEPDLTSIRSRSPSPYPHPGW